MGVLKFNSRTFSPEVSKISYFFLMLFGHIVAKFQINCFAGGGVIFRTRGHENLGLRTFSLLLQMADFFVGEGGSIWSQKSNCWS